MHAEYIPWTRTFVAKNPYSYWSLRLGRGPESWPLPPDARDSTLFAPGGGPPTFGGKLLPPPLGLGWAFFRLRPNPSEVPWATWANYMAFELFGLPRHCFYSTARNLKYSNSYPKFSPLEVADQRSLPVTRTWVFGNTCNLFKERPTPLLCTGRGPRNIGFHEVWYGKLRLNTALMECLDCKWIHSGERLELC